MLGWLKDKVGSGFEAVQRASLVSDLTTYFAPIENLKNGPPNLASRLAGFVVDCEGPQVLADLKASKSGHAVYSYGDDWPGDKKRSFNTLLKSLSPDTDRLVRFGLALEAAYGHNSFYASAAVPGFAGRCDWIATFLKFVATAASGEEKNFPANLVEAMVMAQGADASALASGALLVQDAQGKWQKYSWHALPCTYFQSLHGFSDILSRFPDIVQQGLQQSNSKARAYTLTALHALQVPIGPFLDEIAALSVSGSKEVRESAEPIVTATFDGFRPLLEASAAKGSSDERYHSVRLLARVGGLNVRPFLAQRLEAEKTSKVAEALQELLAEPGTNGTDQDRPEDFGLGPVPDVPAIAPLDKQVLADLRACVQEYERKAAEEFANSEWAKQQNRTRQYPHIAEA